jgi:hypothetical protein
MLLNVLASKLCSWYPQRRPPDTKLCITLTESQLASDKVLSEQLLNEIGEKKEAIESR